MTRIGAPLTERQVQIVLAVVREHLKTGAPVGSKVVQQVYGVQAASATIRNEMVEIEEAGYLYQPHASAGRLPCDSAYRLYVNYLVGHEAPEPPEARWTHEYRRLADAPDQLLRETSRLLSRITSHPAVVTSPPAQEPEIASIILHPISATAVVLTYKTSAGAEKHHLLETREPVTAAQVEGFGAALNALLAGKTLSAMGSVSVPSVQAMMKEQAVPTELLKAIGAAVGQDEESAVYVDGTSYILDEPEFDEREILKGFMQTLDEDSMLRQVLREAVVNQDITITIGDEHLLPQIRSCSLVATSYPYRGSRGAVGILGPMRMDYRRAMGAVSFVARKLGEALSQITR